GPLSSRSSVSQPAVSFESQALASAVTFGTLHVLNFALRHSRWVLWRTIRKTLENRNIPWGLRLQGRANRITGSASLLIDAIMIPFSEDGSADIHDEITTALDLLEQSVDSYGPISWSIWPAPIKYLLENTLYGAGSLRTRVPGLEPYMNRILDMFTGVPPSL